MRGPIWVCRNTVVGLPMIEARSWPLKIRFENDVVVHHVTTFGGTVSGKCLMSEPNAPQGRLSDPALRENITLASLRMECHGDSGGGILDAQHRLSGAFRPQYLGSQGAEIVLPDRVFADGFENAALRPA